MSENDSVLHAINVYVNPDESKDAQSEAFNNIKTFVQSNSVNDLIEMLEDQLVSIHDRVRNRTTTLLAELFHQINFDLQGSVLHLYVVFFNHRLSDFPSVIPSLHALTALVQFYGPKFEPKYNDSLDIFQSVFNALQVPAYAQTVRFKVYLLFKAILTEPKLTTALESHGVEILEGIICCMEEEKDPRCLLEVFQVVHSALKLFWRQLKHRVSAATSTAAVSEADSMQQSFKESSATNVLLSIRIFEALNCYFPITFRPPPNDPFGITSEMLISALEDCLCFTPDAILSNTSDSYSIGIGKRKLSPQESAVPDDGLHLEDFASSVTDDADAMVRLSIPYLLEQLSEEEEEDGPPVTRVHTLRALVRIIRSSPHAHRVLGLRSPPEEGYGRSSTSANWNEKVSAQDRQLMDMVGSDDDDVTGCKDLYIQDKAGRTLPAKCRVPWAASPPAETQLLSVLRDLADRLFTLLVSKINPSSAGPDKTVSEETVFALTLVGEISSSVVRTEGIDSAAWKCFVEPLLSQVSTQLMNDATTEQARAAIDIAYAVARMTSQISSSGYEAVLKIIAPLLLQVCETAHTDANALLQRGAQDAVRCTTAAVSVSTGGTTAPGNEGKLVVGSEMLAQLISCAGGDNTKCAHPHRTHPDSAGSCSTVLESALVVEVLQPYAGQIFDTLTKFASPQKLQVAPPTEKATVNPFLAVKASFGDTAAAESEKALSEPSKEFLPPAPCMLAVVGSISAMRELLQRLPASEFPNKELCSYVCTITDIACYGMSIIVKAEPSVLIVPSEDTRVTSEILYRSCVSFLVSLVDIVNVEDSYSSIVLSNCVHPLLQAARDANISHTAQKRVYGLLGALARTCSMQSSQPNQVALQSQSVFGMAVFNLTEVIHRRVELAASLDSVDALHSAVLALQNLVDVVPSPVSESSVSAASDSLKLQFLIRADVNTADATKSLVLSIVSVIFRHITTLVSMQQRVSASTDALISLISALYALLRGTTCSLNATDTAIAQHQQQHATDVLCWLLQQQSAEGICERALVVGMMVNTLVFLSKESATFQHNTQSGVLTCAVTFALQFTVYRDNIVRHKSGNYDDYVAVFERSTLLNSFNAAQLFAIIVNKIQEHSQCEEQLLCIITAVSSSSSDINVDTTADILLYTVKGVCMRKNITMSAKSNDNLSSIVPYTVCSSNNSWQDWLMQYVVAVLTPVAAVFGGDRQMSLAVASKMHILTTDNDIILSQNVLSSSNVAMFWKQKLWNRMFTQLSQSAPIARMPSDNLLAICALARGVPVNVLQERWQVLVELVVQSMLRTQNSDDNTAESSTLATAALTVQSMCTLEMLLRAEPALFASYLNIIIPAILKTSHQARSARLRVTALEGLLAVTEHIPYTRLYPFRTLVSKELLRALDDCKAGVRVLAGRIRNKWLIMK